MGSVAEVRLSHSCHDGGGCCESPCGPIYVRDEVTGEVIRIDAVRQEEPQPEITKQNRLRALGRRIMGSLA